MPALFIRCCLARREWRICECVIGARVELGVTLRALRLCAATWTHWTACRRRTTCRRCRTFCACVCPPLVSSSTRSTWTTSSSAWWTSVGSAPSAASGSTASRTCASCSLLVLASASASAAAAACSELVATCSVRARVCAGDVDHVPVCALRVRPGSRRER